MIQANELRIGNLFYDEDKTPCYFAGAWQRQDGWIYRDSANNTYKDSQMYPIPLTPEILEKAGFVLEGDTGYYRKMFAYADSTYPCYLLYSLENEYIQVCRNFTAAADAPCKYLHQLQNLIFALTAQELTINL